jgi:hypothetical protein
LADDRPPRYYTSICTASRTACIITPSLHFVLGLQEFFDCETVASVSSHHSRMGSADLTNFPITGGSLPTSISDHHHQQQLEAAVATAAADRKFPAAGSSSGQAMRKSGSARSIAASPAVSTPLAVSPEKKKGAAVAAFEPQPEWVVAEGEQAGCLFLSHAFYIVPASGRRCC